MTVSLAGYEATRYMDCPKVKGLSVRAAFIVCGYILCLSLPLIIMCSLRSCGYCMPS